VALFKKTLAFATGLVSAWFKILPEILTWAKQPKGNISVKKTNSLLMIYLL